MPRVPVLEERVAIGAPNVPVKQPLRPPAEAFGADVQAANARLGQQIQKTGQVAFDHVLEFQQRADEQAAIELQNKFQIDLQGQLTSTENDKDGTPKGFLSRKMNQAAGSTIQFDEAARAVKKQYLEAAPGPTQRARLNQFFSAHLTNAREQVIRHEAAQGRAAFDSSFKASQDLAIGAAAGLADAESVGRAITAAQQSAGPAYRHHGLGEAEISAANQELAGKITESALTALIERDPKAAQDVLNGNKASLSPLVAVKMQTVIEGKMIHDQQAAAWDAVSGFRLSTGEMDIAKVHKYVDGLEVPEERKAKIFSFVHSMSNVANAELKSQRESAEREFTNNLVTQHSKGLPYQDALAQAARFGYDATDIANKQNTVTELYTGKVNSFDTWINKQPEATQGAWSYAEETIKGKYGTTQKRVPGYANPVKLADAAITELKQDALGKTPEQIRELVNKKLEKVVIKPGWLWDTKGEGWKVDAGLRQGLAEATSLLEKDYGAARVGQARTYLMRNSIPITPLNLKKILDQLGADQ